MQPVLHRAKQAENDDAGADTTPAEPWTARYQAPSTICAKSARQSVDAFAPSRAIDVTL